MPQLRTEAEAALAAHIEDLCAFVRRRSVPRFTDFLDRRAQAVAENAAKAGGCIRMWSAGYEGEAERRVLGLFPEGAAPTAGDFPIVALRTRIPKGFTLTHRDFLGAALALGIKREVVGDILITEEFAFLFTLQRMEALFLQELRQVGRVGVEFSPVDGCAPAAAQRFEESRKSVASLRLDCVVAALVPCGRSRAAELIAAGLVSVDGFPEEKGSRVLRGGERIAVRGKGKFILEADGGATRKGRQLIRIKKFL